MIDGKRARSSAAMMEALRADGPFPEYADKLMLFGRLIGSWDIEDVFFDENGNVRKRQHGEWHFGWVLEGRVVQDVIISPPRASRAPGETSLEYGTTIRAYDPAIDAWRVTFVAPVYGVSVNLIAREDGDEIWLEGPAPDGRLYRWTFSDMTDERALWQGFVSADEGRNWWKEEEIRLRRRADLA